MKKIYLIAVFTFFSMMVIFGCGEEETPSLIQQSRNRPNIVLMVSDDHGMDALGVNGNSVIETPHLDALAGEGTFFRQAFGTSASCSPSRSVIFTGLQNHFNGMYGLSHHPHNFSSFKNMVSLPVILASHDYRTARIGKFHVAPEEVYRFEEVLSVGEANDPASIGRSPVEMANVTEEFIDLESDKPFFLYYGTDDPHRSNLMTPDGGITFESYPDPNPFGNREGSYPGITEVIYDPEEVLVPSYLPDNKATREEIAQYYQSTSRMDQGLGRLIEILKKEGQYDNTLIIYVSDNGPAFPASKTTMYDPGIHLPLIIKAPFQQNKSLVQEGMVSLTDLTPTILDYANITVSEGDFHGHSFKELVETEVVGGWDEVYGSHTMHGINMYYPMRMVRTRKYKLIYNIAHQLPFQLAMDLIQSPTWVSVKYSEYFGEREKESLLYRPEYELYDLENDPNEFVNLADRDEYHTVLESMKSKLREFQVRTGDPRLRLPVME